MANLLQITLTNGIPTAGNGIVSTIDALMQDGGQATLGFKTDSALTQTDGTAVSVISALKQCSKSLQALVSVTPTSLSPQGAFKVDGSGTALPVSITGAGIVSLAQGFASKVSFTSSTTAIPAGGVVSAGGSGVLLFAGIASGSQAVEIRSAQLEIDRTAVLTGETSYTLHLYNASPPSGIAAGSAWSLPSGDRASYLGNISLGTPAALGGSVVYNEVYNVGKQFKTIGTSIYGYLVSAGGYTPTAVAVSVTLNTKTV